VATLSVYKQAGQLETYVGSILSAYDVADFENAEKELVNNLRYQLVDARLDARDYEYAQTRAEQLQHAKQGKEHLLLVRHTILKASEYNLFGPIDVAQLSATIELLISRME
jgi:hypothetical protein